MLFLKWFYIEEDPDKASIIGVQWFNFKLSIFLKLHNLYNNLLCKSMLHVFFVFLIRIPFNYIVKNLLV